MEYKKANKRINNRINKSISKGGDKKVNFKQGELKEIILKSLALILVVGGSIAFPNLPIVIASIIKIAEEARGIKIPKHKIKRVLKKLEEKEIIVIEERNNDIFIQIKDKNNTSILKYSLQALLDFKKKKKQWRGKWVLVFFDVPEKQRNKRDFLRKFLYQLGFYPYQKSVYLFPYECEKEIALIKKITESGKYLKYVIAEKIEDEEEVKRFFKL